jgi:lysophospholipase L1-like esterase
VRPALALLAALALGAGCGGGGERNGQMDAPGDPNVVAALCDSITSGSPGFDPDAATGSALGFGTDQRSQWEYWAERAHPGLDLSNCGVFAERTDEIAARLEDCVDRADASAIVIQGGINDIAQHRPVEAAAASLAAMVERAKDLGLRVAIAEVLPWNNGHPADDPQISDLNRLIAGIAHSQRITLLPFHETLEDTRRPGLIRPEWTADGDHPSIEGYRRLGELAYRPPR